MKRATVSQAKALCEALNARAVIILALDKDNIAGASYGQTKAECRETGYTLDQIIDMIDDGRILVWDASGARRTFQKVTVRKFSAENR